MKKISIEKIKQLDYILFFIIMIIALIIMIGASIYMVIDSFSYRHSTPAHVEVIDEDMDVEIKENIKYLTKLKDTFVFSIESNGIKTDSQLLEAEGFSQNTMRKSYSKSSEISESVNFIFIKNDEELKLFSSNVFIYKYMLYDDDNNYLNLNFNVYAVVKSDSNNDKKLDSKDIISLYVSDYDGNNLKEISSSIYIVKVINKNSILFVEKDNNLLNYYEYDGKETKLIKSFEQELNKKMIDLIYY